jgi:lysophospholipase L1-like esterase
MATLLEQIANIQTLIEKLEDLAFGDDATTATYNGLTRDSLSKAIKGKFDEVKAMVQGRKSFETLSELNGFTPTADANGQYALAEVWNDSTLENNGVYGYADGVWTPSSYDSAKLVKDYISKDFNRSEFALVFYDDEKNAILAVTKDRKLVFFDNYDVIGDINLAKETADTVAGRVVDLPGRPDFLWSVSDDNDQTPIGIDRFADFWIKEGNVSKFLRDFDLTRADATDAAITELSNKLTGGTDFVGYGDSLTFGVGTSNAGVYNYVKQLSDLYSPSRSYAVSAIGGQVSDQISVRAGASAIKISVTGGVIPTSAAVAVTNISNKILSTAADVVERSVTGYLHNVRGTLTRLSNDTYNFQQINGTADILIPDNSIFTVDATDYSESIHLIWMGQNDSDKTDHDKIISNIRRVVETLRHDKYVVLPVLTGELDTLGTTRYTDIMNLNDAIALEFGSHYCDIRSELVNNYNDADAQDVTDHDNDIVPSSLRSDGIHLNETGYAIVANHVKKLIDNNGW